MCQAEPAAEILGRILAKEEKADDASISGSVVIGTWPDLSMKIPYAEMQIARAKME